MQGLVLRAVNTTHLAPSNLDTQSTIDRAVAPLIPSPDPPNYSPDTLAQITPTARY